MQLAASSTSFSPILYFVIFDHETPSGFIFRIFSVS